MKDYSVEITVIIPIRAKDENQAYERAGQLEELAFPASVKLPKWVYGDIDLQSRVDEQ